MIPDGSGYRVTDAGGPSSPSWRHLPGHANSAGSPFADGGPAVLDVRDLRTHFFTKRGVGKAVDGVSFVLGRGETLGLVGESGSGKSMTCLSIMRLNPEPASRVVGGRVMFGDVDLLQVPERDMGQYRGGRIAMVLQDPMTALNPVLTIGEQIFESLRLLPMRPSGGALKARAIELMRLMRIPSPEIRLTSYPHQFSGGMRQRVAGAIALARDPEVIIADEATTALDVTIQASYLELLRDIQRRSGISIIFVTHDFGIVAEMCDRVAVMYAGRIVESTATKSLFSAPAHPYSKALLNSVPDVSAQVTRLYSIDGQPPSIFNPPMGCRFHPRCPLRDRLGAPKRCASEEPELREIRPGHVVACHFAEEQLQVTGTAINGRNSETLRVANHRATVMSELEPATVPGTLWRGAAVSGRGPRRWSSDQPIVQVTNLRKHFPVGGSLPFSRTKAWVHAVDGVSFTIQPGQTLGLVGESGCGKSTTSKLMLRLEKPTAGDISFEGKSVPEMRGRELRRYRSLVQAVFQDPGSSLAPRMRVRDIVAEPVLINMSLTKSERSLLVDRILAEVGLDPAAGSNFPHEFSGGQQQRIAVGRALALNPKLIVLDEPVSALDVSIRAQIMNLLKDLQAQHGMSYLLIAHNLATVRYLSHHVAVMYLGQIVEMGRSEDLFDGPMHPYTQALVSASMSVTPGEEREAIILAGEVPSSIEPPTGCRFHPRCPLRTHLGKPQQCETEQPQLREIRPGHVVACHFAEQSSVQEWSGETSSLEIIERGVASNSNQEIR